MKNVLITSAGRRVSLLESFRSALKRRNSGKVFAVDMNPARSPACQRADKAFAVPRATDPAYGDRLFDLCREHDIGLIIPTIDTELIPLAEEQARFEAAGIKVVISAMDLICDCRDKERTAALFERLGIRVPQLYPHEAPCYPCFAKPRDGSCSIDLHLVEHPDNWPPDVLGNPRFLLYEYLDHAEHQEYTIDLYYDRNHELKCMVPRERIETRAGEVSKGATRRLPVLEPLKEKLAVLPGAIGCITLQVFVNKGTDAIFGIEVNPRFGGGFPLSHQAGADYPDWLIGEYVYGEPPTHFDGWRQNLVLLRYDAEVFVHENSDL